MCNLTLLWVWEDQAESHVGDYAGLLSSSKSGQLQGSAPAALSLLSSLEFATVVNNNNSNKVKWSHEEIMDSHIANLPRLRRGNSGRCQSWWRSLCSCWTPPQFFRWLAQIHDLTFEVIQLCVSQLKLCSCKSFARTCWSWAPWRSKYWQYGGCENQMVVYRKFFSVSYKRQGNRWTED